MLSQDEMRAAVVAAHLKFQDEYRATVKISSPDVHCSATSLWRNYFNELAAAIYWAEKEAVGKTVSQVRKDAFAMGRAETVIQNDGFPYTPEAK